MIPVPVGVRVWLATGHTDMRRGFDGLALLVQETLKHDPHGGHLFVFRGQRDQCTTFCIRFAARDGRLSLASSVRAHACWCWSGGGGSSPSVWNRNAYTKRDEAVAAGINELKKSQADSMLSLLPNRYA